MNRDDIRRMAQEAGFLVDEKARGRQPNCIFHTHHMIDELLERFAALVQKHAISASMPAIKLAMAEERKNGAREERQACEELWEQLRIKDDQIRDVIEASVAVEREACAQIALQWDKEHPSTNFGGCIARSIRARGQHDQG
jgi:hypothetical protein